MTFIDYFVSAYYSKESNPECRRIINTCDKKYAITRFEYEAMKHSLSSDEIVDWIYGKIKYARSSFIKIYRN